ncbi:hypothetical protein OVA06_00480 [Pseudarthrobacter sp. SL88]|uniref:hypothetical protein n=1 Tax=Pseudarthrobacter sp. SL88 TaxID=2994666 RepID=UPI00227675B3|nr:hypothetical protein [Pseudarthrobacter sp. SL88]MCY1673201.1 hypothetical protein [Pseudarthrobacter sp. SL88]
MTLQSYLIEAGAIEATAVPRGGSYVTLPAGQEASPRPEGSMSRTRKTSLKLPAKPRARM